MHAAFPEQGVRNVSVFVMDPPLPTAAPSPQTEEGNDQEFSVPHPFKG